MIYDEDTGYDANTQGALAPQDAFARVICASSIAMLREASRLNVDANALVIEAGLDPAALADPANRIPVRQQELIHRLAQEATGDPLLALHAAERVPIGQCGALEIMAYSARSVGEALTRVAQQFPLLHDTVRLEVVPVNHEVAVQLTSRASAGVVRLDYAEYCFGLVASHLRFARPSPVVAARVELCGGLHGSVSEYERVFRCQVLTGASHRLVFSRSDWDRPLWPMPPRMQTSLSVPHTAKPEEHPLVVDVCQRVKSSLSVGEANLSQVARSLGMHGRTLERRLNAMGVTFARLRDHVRRQCAEHLLARTSMPLASISHELGYAEQSAFTRAFRKWTGCSPSEYRGTPAKHYDPAPSCSDS